MPVAINHCEPIGLVPVPTVLTSSEFLNLLSMHDLAKLLVDGMSERRVRDLVKKAKHHYKVSVLQAGCAITRIGTPRPGLTLTNLDAEIHWHADRVAVLLVDRKQMVEFERKEALKPSVVFEDSVVDQEDVEAALIRPPSGHHDHMRFDNVFGQAAEGQQNESQHEDNRTQALPDL